ncbi:putative F-box/LRR-repeat protein At3g18150 [Salvia miltiorrhiza]|uniref:putative F-box/LRR-repeat protein At3g18150 n=1 Tax=Salvia miltiorrhiza TaxID=226208 RepID=UPI0025AD26D1|nr:putative F-box/LRR-repeat protein At3g18150 [Salvia miltiorrhiza]
MKKRKKKACPDRLSELPNSLIHLIFSFLPTKYAVRTTLLSKRWRDFWLTVPTLNFHDRDFLYRREAPLFDFVDLALILWNGARLSRFDLAFNYHRHESGEYESRSYRNYWSASLILDLWLRFAAENAVEELILDLIDGDDAKEGLFRETYWLPQRLYSCSSIRELSLAGCVVSINGGVNWDRLRVLRIEGSWLRGYNVGRVLRGAPRLEVLILRVFGGGGRLSIVSDSLKKVVVERYERGDGDDDGDLDYEEMKEVMDICAPNVETLQVLGVMYRECVVEDVSCLRNAIFEFDLSRDYQHGRSPGYELVEDVLGQDHPTRVETVTLSSDFEVMADMKKKYCMLASLSSTRCLKLYATKVEKIVEILQVFPRMMMLVLQHSDLREGDHHDVFEIIRDDEQANFLESKTDFPESSLLQLRTVEITWYADDDAIFPFIELLLKYGRKLEKMVIMWLKRNGEVVEKEECFALAEEKVLSMWRSSPTANVQHKELPLSQ